MGVMVAFASMNQEDAGRYAEVKQTMLQRYEVNKETQRLRFWKDCHGVEGTYCEWSEDRRGMEEAYHEWSQHLHKHFDRWRKDYDIPLEELILIEQFIAGVSPDQFRQEVCSADVADAEANMYRDMRPTQHSGILRSRR